MARPELVDKGQLLHTTSDAQLAFISEGHDGIARIIQDEIPADLLPQQRDSLLLAHAEDVIAEDPSVLKLLEMINKRIDGVPELTLIVGGLNGRSDHERE